MNVEDHVCKDDMQIEIAPMDETDILAIKEIEETSFHFPWSEGMFLEEIRSPLSHCRVARLQQEKTPVIGGYLICRICAGETHLYNLAVKKDCRRQGLAGLLLEDMVLISKAASVQLLYLEVGVSNEAAVKLYEKHGFQRVGIRKGYYGESGENALLMYKKLGANIRASEMSP